MSTVPPRGVGYVTGSSPAMILSRFLNRAKSGGACPRNTGSAADAMATCEPFSACSMSRRNRFTYVSVEWTGCLSILSGRHRLVLSSKQLEQLIDALVAVALGAGRQHLLATVVHVDAV